MQGTSYTLHLRHPTDHGKTWSADLLTIANAKNPGLAVKSEGRLGLLYQQLTGPIGEDGEDDDHDESKDEDPRAISRLLGRIFRALEHEEEE